MSERRATLEWRNGQTAMLTVDGGWSVDPPDPTLEQLLERSFNLAAIQARRETLHPDLLGTAARAAAAALGADVVISTDPALAPPAG